MFWYFRSFHENLTQSQVYTCRVNNSCGLLYVPHMFFLRIRPYARRKYIAVIYGPIMQN